METKIVELENKIIGLENRLKDIEFLGVLFLASQSKERLSKLWPNLKTDIDRIWAGLDVINVVYPKKI